MSQIDVNGVLAQIRALSAQAAAQQSRTAAAPAASGSDGFGSLLRNSIDKVNSAQGEASRQQRAFEMGDANTDLASVMLATTKAQVSFRSMVEVRNRLISAYQDIMNMPL